MSGWLAGLVLGFVIGFALAAECGRIVYNRKMDEIRAVAQSMKQIVHEQAQG